MLISMHNVQTTKWPVCHRRLLFPFALAAPHREEYASMQDRQQTKAAAVLQLPKQRLCHMRLRHLIKLHASSSTLMHITMINLGHLHQMMTGSQLDDIKCNFDKRRHMQGVTATPRTGADSAGAAALERGKVCAAAREGPVGGTGWHV